MKIELEKETAEQLIEVTGRVMKSFLEQGATMEACAALLVTRWVEGAIFAVKEAEAMMRKSNACMISTGL